MVQLSEANLAVVLDYTRTLPQSDGLARPAAARGLEGSHRDPVKTRREPGVFPTRFPKR